MRFLTSLTAVISVGATLGGARVNAQMPMQPPSAPDPAYSAPVLYPAPIPPVESRSPGLAVGLSLQPLPVDLGNLYAENWGWGVAYTAVEVSLLAPMMWMTGEHMNHGAGDSRSWSGMEMGAMGGFAAAYVAVKIVSGIQAGRAADEFNRASLWRPVAFVAPTRGAALLGGGVMF